VEAAPAEPLGETIDVDGVSRPTTNSTGQPIHPTAEGVRNFWRWATEDGREPVMDADGKPIVALRGDREDITNFTEGRRRERGFFLAAERERADFYGKNVKPLYMRAEKVLDARNATRE
jgi:hypothetical protein